PYLSRHSAQMARTRSTSGRAPEKILNFLCCVLRFIGSAERRLWKPECISPETDRQCARATRSAGNSPASGAISFRYSAIASVSQTVTPPWTRRGTSTEGGQQQQLLARLGGIDIDGLLDDVQARHPAQQPA